MFGTDNLIEYIIQLPQKRFLAKIKNKDFSVLNRVHTQYLFTLSLEKIRETIINDIKNRFSVTNLRSDNTLISRVLKYRSQKNEFYYILTADIGCRFVESCNRFVYEYNYPVSKALIQKVLTMNKQMITYPKLLSVAEETALETINNQIYI